jgi:hypothetical protein
MATETVCRTVGCFAISPVGNVKCRECAAAASRKYARENPEAMREKAKRWRADNPEAYREMHNRASRKYCANNKEVAGEYSRSPRGRALRNANNARRKEREAEANYTDLRHLDGDTCYICGQQSDKLDIEHVIPLSKWKAAVASDGVTESAWRTGCYDCNRGVGGKFETAHSAYLLRRFRAGKPLKPPHRDGQEPPHGTLAPHLPGWLLTGLG